ncbi:MAG: hypothetical protein LBE14_02890 [Treponema sp.]|nr:hypothetical protein [Treponema sp.]
MGVLGSLAMGIFNGMGSAGKSKASGQCSYGSSCGGGGGKCSYGSSCGGS